LEERLLNQERGINYLLIINYILINRNNKKKEQKRDRDFSNIFETEKDRKINQAPKRNNKSPEVKFVTFKDNKKYISLFYICLDHLLLAILIFLNQNTLIIQWVMMILCTKIQLKFKITRKMQWIILIIKVSVWDILSS